MPASPRIGTRWPIRVGDVAIDRAFRGLQLGRNGVRRQRLAGAPEHLDDLEQPVGASHRISLVSAVRLADADRMLSAGAFYNGTTLQLKGIPHDVLSLIRCPRRFCAACGESRPDPGQSGLGRSSMSSPLPHLPATSAGRSRHSPLRALAALDAVDPKATGLARPPYHGAAPCGGRVSPAQRRTADSMVAAGSR